MSNTVTTHEFVDRTLHHVDERSTAVSDAPQSLALPISTVVEHKGETVGSGSTSGPFVVCESRVIEAKSV